MTVNRIKIFLTGMIFGILVLVLAVWFSKDIIINKLKMMSFFGYTPKQEIRVLQKDSKLYQGNLEVGILKKGMTLEYTSHVDKIDHYNLNFLVEPFANEKISNMFADTRSEDNFSTTVDLRPINLTIKEENK